MADKVIVKSEVFPISTIFRDKYSVDFFQREYVWQKKHLEDLLMDLSTEFLKNYKPGDQFYDVAGYNPYFMGEIVVSTKEGGVYSLIDGQQRITTFTLLLIYLTRKLKNNPDFPLSDIEPLIQGNHFGKKRLNLQIEEREECIQSLLNNGEYSIKDTDPTSVKNIVDIYECIDEIWNPEINESNIIHFVYWITGCIMFSRVWTNSDEFAYVIFETMNDRGLSLTQVEMLRSYLLANINESSRNKAMGIFDDVVHRLTAIKLSSKSKAEFEFFKTYLRGHYANDPTTTKNGLGDFERIGKEFHRWIRDNTVTLGLNTPVDYMSFLNRLAYFAKVYERIHKLITERNTVDYLYLIVNSDYGFTLQPQLIMAAVNENDDDATVDQKIKMISKYLTKVLTWRVWNHWLISQSAMENNIYELCKQERGKDLDELKELLDSDPIPGPILENYPELNQTNRWRLKVMLSLITEIVAANSGNPDYMLNKNYKVEIEHIWANHFEQHTDECAAPDDFASVRNSIGDLLVLPKNFNSSYNDGTYDQKMPHYYEQNILAQSLCSMKYQNNPGFKQFINQSGLPFKPYDEFKRASITERGELYKAILKWNWGIDEEVSPDKETARAKSVFDFASKLMSENSNIGFNPNYCSIKYLRFHTPFMDEMFAKSGTSTGWKDGSHYFYEMYNKIGKNAAISLVISQKGLPDVHKAKIDRILNLAHKEEKKKNGSYLTLFKTEKHPYGIAITQESVSSALNSCLEEIDQFEKMIADNLNQ